MSKIIVDGSWDTWDSLDGQPLTEGERLSVQWPDGSHEAVEVRLYSKTTPFHEQGHMHSTGIITNRRARARVEYHGAKGWVYLRGLHATRALLAR